MQGDENFMFLVCHRIIRQGVILVILFAFFENYVILLKILLNII